MTAAALRFEFQMPTRIVVQDGGRAHIAEHLMTFGIRRLLLITDPGVKRTGVLAAVHASLAATHIHVDEFAGVQPNPRTVDCNALAAEYRGCGIDGVLAVGGGSAIDFAKAMSVLLTHDGVVEDYVSARPLTRPVLPVTCIPTTAGTGSEVTYYAVLTDPVLGAKVCLADTRLAPVLAVLDAQVLATLPAAIVASTGLDALTHAIEAYTGRRANPFSDALALGAIRSIAMHLEAAVDDATTTARGEMLVASTMAGLAFGNADVAAVHCLAEALGGRYNWPHGVCNAILLPHVFAHNMSTSPLRHAAVAYALGVDRTRNATSAADAAVTRLFELTARLAIPRLQAMQGVDPADFAQLAAHAKANISDSSNARAMSTEDYAHILEVAYSE